MVLGLLAVVLGTSACLNPDKDGDNQVARWEVNGGTVAQCELNVREMMAGNFPYGGEREFCLEIIR